MPPAGVPQTAAKSYYEEKHDKGSFIKNIISDNILISDIYMRAKELHVDAEVARWNTCMWMRAAMPRWQRPCAGCGTSA